MIAYRGFIVALVAVVAVTLLGVVCDGVGATACMTIGGIVVAVQGRAAAREVAGARTSPP